MPAVRTWRVMLTVVVPADSELAQVRTKGEQAEVGFCCMTALVDAGASVRSVAVFPADTPAELARAMADGTGAYHAPMSDAPPPPPPTEPEPQPDE